MHLARGLRALGVDARIVLTAPGLRDFVVQDFPRDVPVDCTPAPHRARWRDRCVALLRYLEERAPCFYLPNYDWFHSCVSPRLSEGVAIVGILHSDDPGHYRHATSMGRYWNAIAGVSPAITAEVGRLAPHLISRLATIPYGVEPLAPPAPRPRADGEPLRVVYHGRLEQSQKRIFDLVAVIRRTADAGVPGIFTVIGDGPQARAVLDRCRALPRRGLVRVTGPLPNGAALAQVESHHVFLLTSAFEGLPLSLLEAMARGCVPVVADVRSGIPDVVTEGENGFRVPVGDIGGFVERLSQLANDDSLRMRMSAAAWQTATSDPYRRETMVDAYRALFAKVRAESEAGEFRRPRGKVQRPASVRWWHLLPYPVYATAYRAKRWARARRRPPTWHE